MCIRDRASAKPKVKGSVLYSAKNLVENKVGIADAVKATYGKKVLPPYLGRTAAVLPPAPDNIRLNGADLSWGAVSNVAYYAIYKAVSYTHLDVYKRQPLEPV